MYLTDETREMLSSGAERIYGFGEPRAWDGRWLLVVVRVPEQRRDVRHLIRSQLAWAGFGSLGNGLWISPHVDRESEVRRIVSELSPAELLSFRAEFGSVGDPAKVVADAWDLGDVADRYREFISRFGRLRPKSPEAAFRAQTEIVHTWRKFPFLDPDLPQEMLPPRWPRTRAHEVFAGRHDEWRSAARRSTSDRSSDRFPRHGPSRRLRLAQAEITRLPRGCAPAPGKAASGGAVGTRITIPLLWLYSVVCGVWGTQMGICLRAQRRLPSRCGLARRIENMLFFDPKTAMLFGDAKASIVAVTDELNALGMLAAGDTAGAAQASS